MLHAPMSGESRSSGLVLRSARFALGRREALAAAAVLPFGWACSRSPSPREASSAACLLSPENVEGPFYVDDARVRSDLREDRRGVPLVLDAAVVDARTCAPLAGAAVDIWHCDAAGAYSGFVEDGMRPPLPGGPGGGRPPGGPGGRRPPGPRRFDPDHPPPRPHPTDAARFLRGVQLTDAAGRVRFTTLYPGWYAGRAVHIHVRVRVGGAARGETYDGGHVAHTGQLFFPEAVSDAVFTRAPYAAHAGRRTLQTEDGIFGRDGSGGMLALQADGGDGYTARTTMGIDRAAARVPMR
jgi:protocatechuate 3,4-dioxygenase beta subunit